MASSPPAQYQHFVPQFLLRNFAHPYTPEGDGHTKRKDKRKRNYKKGMYPGDPVVRNIDLQADPPVICEKPVKRILGLMNMYDDTTKSSEKQQREVELMFSKLEAQASQVFRKITKAYEKEDPGLWLTRDERDLVRKFLFIQKYRGLTFHRRFNHDNPESYEADDRQLMVEYMAEKGFARPMDVWLDNVKAIIEADMDLDLEWPKRLAKRMYLHDALWFFTHVEASYMAICTPSNTEDELLLTDNSYNVFEGPNQFVRDQDSGKLQGFAYTELHGFAPISPKLMIVMRSNVLPNPLEDKSARVKAQRERDRHLVIDDVYGYEVESWLSDLPIDKAENNYSEMINGQSYFATGEDGKKKKSHKFYFRLFPIETEHVNKINAVLLENCCRCTSIVFDSQKALARTLEWYLSDACEFGKKIMVGEEDGTERALMKLEHVSRALGSNKETVWKRIHVPMVKDYAKFLDEITKRAQIDQMMLKGDLEGVRRAVTGAVDSAWVKHDTPFVHLYETSLGGSLETIMTDREQIPRMWILRVKIDVWSQGVDEAIREKNRNLLNEAYLRLPPYRVWLYTHHVIVMLLEKGPHLAWISVPPIGKVPVDIVAQARAIISPLEFNRLMFDTGMSYTRVRRFQEDCEGDIWPEVWPEVLVFNPFVLDVLMRLKFITLDQTGFIRDCGIAVIAQLSRQAQRSIIQQNLHREMECTGNFFDEGERIELLTRMIVREGFLDALVQENDEIGLKLLLLGELKEVLFEITYPTPPKVWLDVAVMGV